MSVICYASRKNHRDLAGGPLYVYYTLLSARRPVFDKEKGELKVEIQNFGLSASEPAEVEVICGGHSLGRMTLKTLQPYEVEYLAFSPDAALADDKSSYEVVFFYLV